MIQLTQNIGDTKTFSIPLSWGGRPFVPGSDWNLLFTVKSSVDVPDSERLLQKQTSGLGITVVGRTASVEILRADTFREADYPEVGDAAFEAAAGDYVWDIKATKIDDGETRTVASGTYTLIRPVGRIVEATGPIYTTEDPLVAITGPTGPTGGGTLTYGLTAPVSPAGGDLWYDTGDNSLSVWNPTAAAWVMLTTPLIPANAYLNPSLQPYLNPSGVNYLAAA